jgi:hypothetical protein
MGKNDRRKLKRWCIIGVLVVMGLATLWHFLYEWLPCGFLSVFCPANESPWEHVKLFFVPPLIWYTVMYFIAGRRFLNYMFACAVSLLVMPALMLLIYSVCKALGIDSLPVAIVNTLVSIALGLRVVYRLTISERKLYGPRYTVTAIVILTGLFVLYALLTYYPPAHPLFWDPQRNQYGIPR